MSGVFISYARADEALAWRVTRWLRSLDVHVWWDQDMTSVDWHYELVDRITDLAAVVVIWSPNSWKSKSVRDEARLADDQGKLVNLIIGVPKPLHPFDRITGIDLSDWEGAGSNAVSARIVLAIDRHLAEACTIAEGQLVARQAAQYSEFQAREQRLAAIEADLDAAEATARDAVDAIDTASAALADAEADVANVKVSGLSRSVAAAADAAARTERDSAEARLRDARKAADVVMKRASTLAARRDKLRANFTAWSAERGAEEETSTLDERRNEPRDAPITTLVEPLHKAESGASGSASPFESADPRWSNGETTESDTSAQLATETFEAETDEPQSWPGRRFVTNLAVGFAVLVLVTIVSLFWQSSLKKGDSISQATANETASGLSTVDRDKAKVEKVAAPIGSSKADTTNAADRDKGASATIAKPVYTASSVPAWLVGTWGTNGNCTVTYRLSDGKNGLLLLTRKRNNKVIPWRETILSAKPNNRGQERIETDGAYYVREAQDSVISVVPKKEISRIEPFELTPRC
jgi:hypothetical protein